MVGMFAAEHFACLSDDDPRHTSRQPWMTDCCKGGCTRVPIQSHFVV